MLLHRLLWDGAERAPDRPALVWVDRQRSVTYAEAVALAERAAGALSELGVGRGDRVGLFAHNGLDYLAAMFGAWRLGAISAHISVMYADTLDYYVQDCEPTVLVYTHDQLPAIERHRAAMPSIRHYLCMDGPQDGAISWPDALAAAGPPPADRVDEADVAHLSYTSGTSGPPKGAGLAHEPTARATSCIAERLRITAGDVSVGPTSLSSSYQLVANLLPVLHRHGTCAVIGRWDPALGYDQIAGVGGTILAANPPILTGMLEESRRRGAPPASLRLAVSGGGPVPPELKAGWRDHFGIPLAESYGQSELGGFVGLGAPDLPTDERLAACGRPLPDKEVRVVDDAGREVPTGALGELVLRGGFMAGYWNRPEKTAEVLRGGWLHTGDVGYVDADDFVFMRGRLSERLTVGGVHWYPRDVEEALLRHGAVREAAVVGFPDGHGHRPVAFVTADAGGVPVDEVLASVAAELPAHDIAALSIEVIAALPMTPTGKVSKAQLLDAFA
ncbi:MAG: acyl-CoA synthetase (AMP-forming)/AMP-acid ligase [Actinomycetia bacterium]|nr:acyl-CoA synthetase (AMP-forming)/AMP-acid ligase [Actinomycetes bacterium]